VDLRLHAFLTSSLLGNEMLASLLGRLRPEKSHWQPLNRKLGEARNRSGQFGKRNHSPLCRRSKFRRFSRL